MTFWTGEINDAHRFEAQVGFYDTTLRDGEQTVGVVLTPEDKLELARGLDELGIERFEECFPRVSADVRRAVELIRDAGLNAEVWGFSRAVDADVKALVELGVGASVIESPISDLKLAALGVDREAMLERIVYAISFAVDQGVTVAFIGVVGTRADSADFQTL
jgi:isopropylmalate/homocitrate/citramalate synthase